MLRASQSLRAVSASAHARTVTAPRLTENERSNVTSGSLRTSGSDTTQARTWRLSDLPASAPVCTEARTNPKTRPDPIVAVS